MAQEGKLNIELLRETAINIDKDLKYLPMVKLRPILGKLGINLIEGIQNKDEITNFFRKYGITTPYDAGNVTAAAEVGKAEPVVLEVKLCKVLVKDNIQDYKKTIVGPDVLLGKNKSKQHPWNVVMLTSIATTHGEEIAQVLYLGVYDKADQTPTGVFDGYEKIITDAITGLTISVALGNQFVTGALNNDTVATNVYDKLLAMWRASKVRKTVQMSGGEAIMHVSDDVADLYDDAVIKKFENVVDYDEYGRTFLRGSQQKCRLVRTSVFEGDRVVLTVPGNLDFGTDQFSDGQFIDVSQKDDDPNVINFWLQASYGVRIRSFHKKVFMTNEQVATIGDFAGDY